MTTRWLYDAKNGKVTLLLTLPRKIRAFYELPKNRRFAGIIWCKAKFAIT